MDKPDPIRKFVNDEVHEVDDLPDGKTLHDDRESSINCIVGIDPLTGDLAITVPEEAVHKCQKGGDDFKHYHVSLVTKGMLNPDLVAQLSIEFISLAADLRRAGFTRQEDMSRDQIESLLEFLKRSDDHDVQD